MGMLDGKVAIITGAGRGVGREEALAMAKAGCNLVINDIGGGQTDLEQDTKIADTVVEKCKKLGIKAVANYDSVADFTPAERIVKSCVDSFGRIDILVNCAGILRDRMVFNISEEEWDMVLNIHLKGTFNMCRHASRLMREQKGGRIINTTSDAWRGSTASCTGKAAIRA